MFGRLPGESEEYAAVREELVRAEQELRDQRERVAALRRSLPRDHVIVDQVFETVIDGARAQIKLSELFDDPAKPLVLMHFMYGKAQERPCPMCTMWADGYDGAVEHLRQKVNFAVLIAGDVGVFGDYARGRGWGNLLVCSAADSTLKQELGFELDNGAQLPGVSVFERRDDTLIHFYSQAAMYGPNSFRGMDLLSPVWNFFDLTPQGRGDWMPRRSYD